MTFIFSDFHEKFSLVLLQMIYYIFSPWKMQKKECIILTRYLERRYSSSTSESLEMFTSMMGWGGGRGHKLAQKKTENSDGYWKKSWNEKSSSVGLTFPDTNKEKAKRTFWHWKYFEWLTMDALLQLFNLALVWMMKNIIKLMKLKSLSNF